MDNTNSPLTFLIDKPEEKTRWRYEGLAPQELLKDNCFQQRYTIDELVTACSLFEDDFIKNNNYNYKTSIEEIHAFRNERKQMLKNYIKESEIFFYLKENPTKHIDPIFNYKKIDPIFNYKSQLCLHIYYMYTWYSMLKKFENSERHSDFRAYLLSPCKTYHEYLNQTQ